MSTTACQHAPSIKDRKKAQATYHVAVEMVGNAQKAQLAGDVDGEDRYYRSALKELLEATQFDPENWEVHYLLSTVYLLGFGRYSEAGKHAREAILARQKSVGEPYPEAQQLLGSVLLAQNKVADAIPHFEKARTNLLYSTPYLAEQELGWAYFKLGNTERARFHLGRAVAIHPKLCGAYLKLFEVEDAESKTKAALSVLDAFMRECDTNAVRKHVGKEMLSYAQYRKGMLLLKEGDFVGAKRVLASCNERFPTSSHAAQCQKALRLVP